MHPNQVKAARDRFRLLDPDSDQTKAVRALTRAREDLVGARVALANQLRAELERFWPGPVGLFSDIDSPISLAFLSRYPSPRDARELGERRLAAFLKAYRYTNRKTPAQIRELESEIAEALDGHPDGKISPASSARRTR